MKKILNLHVFLSVRPPMFGSLDGVGPRVLADRLETMAQMIRQGATSVSFAHGLSDVVPDSFDLTVHEVPEAGDGDV